MPATRDVHVASHRVSAEGRSGGLEDAIANVVSTAMLSQIHAQALAATVSGSGLSPEIAARIQTQVSLGLIGNKKHGAGK